MMIVSRQENPKEIMPSKTLKVKLSTAILALASVLSFHAFFSIIQFVSRIKMSYPYPTVFIFSSDIFCFYSRVLDSII